MQLFTARRPGWCPPWPAALPSGGGGRGERGRAGEGDGAGRCRRAGRRAGVAVRISFGVRQLPGALRALGRRFPRVEATVFEEPSSAELERLCRRGVVDLALMAACGRSPADAHHLGYEEFVVVLGAGARSSPRTGWSLGELEGGRGSGSTATARSTACCEVLGDGEPDARPRSPAVSQDRAATAVRLGRRRAGGERLASRPPRSPRLRSTTSAPGVPHGRGAQAASSPWSGSTRARRKSALLEPDPAPGDLVTTPRSRPPGVLTRGPLRAAFAAAASTAKLHTAVYVASKAEERRRPGELVEGAESLHGIVRDHLRREPLGGPLSVIVFSRIPVSIGPEV